jgi:DNA-directed RNA polymerase specialized sigma24 family protein
MAGVAREPFEQAWPTVEARLRRVMAARRVPEADRDDLLQEVAARALASGVAFESADDLGPWAATVLRRLHVDLHRRSNRIGFAMSDGDVPGDDVDAAAEVAVTVEARMDLDAVAKVMATWSPATRQVLLETERAGTTHTSAFYVRRHRLRLKLLAAIDGVGGFLGGIWRRIDPVALADKLRAAEVAPGVLAPMAAAFVMALVLGPIASPPDGTARAAAPPGRDAGRGTSARRLSTVTDAAHIAAFSSLGSDAGGSQVGDHRGGSGRGDGHGKQRASSPTNGPVPIEKRRVEADAGEYDPSVEIETRDGPQPFWCYHDKPVLGEGCVGEGLTFPTLPTP